MAGKTIGILTGGGDVPGLNPCIKSFVLNAHENGYNVIGIRRGWGGFMGYDLSDSSTHDTNVRELNYEDVRKIDRTGGTFLHTSRTNPQKVKPDTIPEHLKDSKWGKAIDNKGTMDYTDYVLEVLDHLGIDYIITIGGDDTLSYGARLHKEGFPVVGIPKTMDNDVVGTDYCIGFSTAVTRSVEFITNMRTSVGSHERIGIIELFGRNSGETSLFISYLAYADRALIPEIPFNLEKLAAFILEDKLKNTSNYAIITVSEGATFEDGRIIESGEADAYGHRKLGGIGQYLSDEIKRVTGQNTMVQQFGYLMRSGPPDTLDRMVATAYGQLALESILRNETGRLVALQDGKYTTVPFEMVVSGKKQVDVDNFYDVENYRPKVKSFVGVPMFLK